MAQRFARCLNRDYCSVGDKGTVLRLADDAPFFCPECAHALVPAPDRRSRSSPLWPAAPERLATCPNRDYCSISDSGRVLRLGAGARVYCPECAHALVRAPDRRRHRRIHWPNVAASILAGIAVAATASALLRPPLPARVTSREPPGSGFSFLPDPSLLVLQSATIGLFPPADSDEPLVRRRRTNGPRVDLASADAAAALRDGLPAGMRWHDDDTPQAISMPWRQALIMAALITPGRSVAEPAQQAAVPQPAPAPSAPPLNNTAAPTTATVAATRLPFARPLPPPPPPTEETARTLLAGTITPPSVQAANPFRVVDDAPARNTAPAAGAAPQLPSAVAPAKHPAEAAAVVAPPRLRAAKLTDRKAKIAARAQTAKKPPPPAKVVAGAKLPQRSPPAPPAPAPPPPATHASADPATPAPPDPHPRIVLLPATAQFSYAPLKDVNFPNLPARFFMSSRPSADKPKKGSLQVDCAIETTGVPSDCHVMNARNAAAVSDALLAWLGSGMVHYTPKTENGHPVRSRRTLTLDFPAEAARDHVASTP